MLKPKGFGQAPSVAKIDSNLEKYHFSKSLKYLSYNEKLKKWLNCHHRCLIYFRAMNIKGNIFVDLFSLGLLCAYLQAVHIDLTSQISLV